MGAGTIFSFAFVLRESFYRLKKREISGHVQKGAILTKWQATPQWKQSQILNGVSAAGENRAMNLRLFSLPEREKLMGKVEKAASRALRKRQRLELEVAFACSSSAGSG